MRAEPAKRRSEFALANRSRCSPNVIVVLWEGLPAELEAVDAVLFHEVYKTGQQTCVNGLRDPHVLLEIQDVFVSLALYCLDGFRQSRPERAGARGHRIETPLIKRLELGRKEEWDAGWKVGVCEVAHRSPISLVPVEAVNENCQPRVVSTRMATPLQVSI